MNRKAAQDSIIRDIEELLPGGGNAKLYQDLFDSMSDEQFDELMQSYKSGQSRPSIIAPNMQENSLSVKRNLALAKKWGHNFFEHLIIASDDPSLPTYRTNEKYLIVELPARRQAQLLRKKISIPEDNKSIDNLSGQPTGKSKGARLSLPEIKILSTLGLDNMLLELLKFRGGDAKGFNAMNESIIKTGGVSLQAILPYSGKVTSTVTLHTYLMGMHLENTL